MARLALTPVVPVGPFPTLPVAANALDFAFVAAGASFADGFGFVCTGRELLLVRNPSGGALTVTLTSVVDTRTGRTGDVTAFSVGAGEFAAYAFLGPNMAPWRQVDGQIYGAASSALLELAVLRLPSIP